MKSQTVYTKERREEVYQQYSPELDDCIDALEASEREVEELRNKIDEIYNIRFETIGKN